MVNVNYKNLIFVPQYVADVIEGANYRKDVRNRVCSFLKNLMRDSKKQYNDGDIFLYVDRSSAYLSKVLGRNYLKYLTPLLEEGIITSTGYRAGNISDEPINRRYRINPYKNYQNNNEDIGSDIISNIVVGNDVLVICQSLKSQTLDSLGFTFLEFEETLQEEVPRKYHKEFLKMMSLLDINIDKLYQRCLEYIVGMSIEDYLVNEEILEDVVAIIKEGKSEVTYFTKEKAILYARNRGKALIQDGLRFTVEAPEAFMERKKRAKLISDLSTIKTLEKKVYRANRNITNNRLDSNLTNMSSYLLEVILEDNGLVEIDLCNSQLAISTLVLDLDTEDFSKYKELALNCGLYEYLVDELKLSSRALAKSTCFEVMFSSPKNRSSSVRKFKALFPTVMSWINEYKEGKGYEQFSISLQKKEAEIFIDNIYEKIKKKGIFVLTKHDSCIVKEKDENQVRDIITTYFKEIGLNIMLR